MQGKKLMFRYELVYNKEIIHSYEIEARQDPEIGYEIKIIGKCFRVESINKVDRYRLDDSEFIGVTQVELVDCYSQ